MGSARDTADVARWSKKAAALALSATLMLSAPTASFAGLNRAREAVEFPDYLSQQLEAKEEVMDIDALYKQQGGACGDGYKLEVKKVLGASCVCVADSCKGENARRQPTDYERFYGIKNK